jgi:hypothetical protein
MRISFFEEYPKKISPEKLDLISWPSTLFIATREIEEYLAVKQQFQRNYSHIRFA